MEPVNPSLNHDRNHVFFLSHHAIIDFSRVEYESNRYVDRFCSSFVAFPRVCLSSFRLDDEIHVRMILDLGKNSSYN